MFRTRSLYVPIVMLAAACASTDQSALLAGFEADRKAIEDLHRRDMEAAKRGDYETLVSLWTDDAVMLPPNGHVVVGIETIRARMEASRGHFDTLEVTEYVQDFKDVEIVGDLALEWGTYRGTTRSRLSGEIVSGKGTLMRLLRKQPDGSWKIGAVDVDDRSELAEGRTSR